MNRLSHRLVWYSDNDGIWTLRIGDKVFGHLVPGIKNYWLFRPGVNDMWWFRTLRDFGKWADEYQMKQVVVS